MCFSDSASKQDSAFCVCSVLQLAKTGPPVTKNFPLLCLFPSDAMMAWSFYTPYDVNPTNLHILTACRFWHILTQIGQLWSLRKNLYVLVRSPNSKIKNQRIIHFNILSLFQALGQWGQSKKQADNKAGSGREKERAGEPESILLKTSFHPLEKRNCFLCQNVKCKNLRMFSIELLAQISRGQADLHSVLRSAFCDRSCLLCLRESLWEWKSLCRRTEN